MMFFIYYWKNKKISYVDKNNAIKLDVDDNWNKKYKVKAI